MLPTWRRRSGRGGGRAATRRAVGAEPLPILYPPDLRLDQRTLAALDARGVRTSLVSGTSLAAISRGLTPAEPVLTSGVRLLPADAELQASLAAARTDLELSRVVAETAMVHFESPARQRTLAVAAAVGTGAHRFASFLEQV